MQRNYDSIYNISNLDLIQSRRIQNEIKSLYDYINYNTNDKVNITDFCVKRDDISFDIIDKNKIYISFFYKDKCSVSMILTFRSTYPFKPPTVYLNHEKDYISLLSGLNPHLNNFTSHTGNNPECFCCKSITCSHNWGPQNKITDVVSEFYKMFEMLDNHIEKILKQKIYDKYLGYNIE
jgi:hypothetical protein